jgi:hypothetical protein
VRRSSAFDRRVAPDLDLCCSFYFLIVAAIYS